MDNDRRPPVLIIGVGNEDRSDDAAGLLVARKLKENNLMAAAVQQQSGEALSLLEAFSGAVNVILVDAVQSGATPGTVHRFEAHREPLPARYFCCSTHSLGVAEAVELARALGRLPHRLLVYGIEGAHFDPGMPISAEVISAIEEVIQQIRHDVEKWLAENPPEDMRMCHNA